MDKTVGNEIRALSELDLAKLQLDAYDGAEGPHLLYVFFRKALNNPNQIPFQCPCGGLGIITRERLEGAPCKEVDGQRELLCYNCGEYSLHLSAPAPYTPLIIAGLDQLTAMFRKAIDDNYMTFCFYLWSSLRAFQPRFHQVNDVCNHIYDAMARNVLLAQLSEDRVGQLKVDKDQIRVEEVIMQLLLINHVFELAELPDVLLTLLSIAESEHFLIGDNGRTIQPVGLYLKFEDGERDQAKKRIVYLRKALHERKYIKLSRLIRKAFNPEVRNAFSHSEYRIEKDGICLTGYNNRLVTNEQLYEMFMGAYALQDTIYRVIEAERRRFIASGGYEEAGWKIIPHFENGFFSVDVITDSIKPQVTGRVRREAMGQ